MSLRGTCPSCAFHADIEAFLVEEELAQEDLLALSMPAALAAEVQQYIRLFKPGERRLSARRRRSVLADLLPRVTAGKLEFDGRVWPAPLDYWRDAMAHMVEHRARLSLPLKSNGYLYRVVAGFAQKADAQAEQQRLARGRGETPPSPSAPPPPAAREREKPRKHNPQAAAKALAEAKTLLKSTPTKGAL